MMTNLLLVIDVIACGITFLFGTFTAINGMDKKTGHWIRAAWVLVTVGALAIIIGPLYGRTPPDLAETVFSVGLAIFVMVDRRRYWHAAHIK